MCCDISHKCRKQLIDHVGKDDNVSVGFTFVTRLDDVAVLRVSAGYGICHGIWAAMVF